MCVVFRVQIQAALVRNFGGSKVSDVSELEVGVADVVVGDGFGGGITNALQELHRI